MTTYLGYVFGGKCRDTHGDPTTKLHKQFWVQQELATLGIDSWVGKRIDFKRQGKRRLADAITSPALPNYIFLDMTAAQFYTATTVKHLAPTLAVVPKQAEKQIDAFKDRIEAAQRAAERIQERDRASIVAYTEGQALQAISGPYLESALRFLRLIYDRTGQPFIEAETELFGRGVAVPLDPLDVRAAE